jgi:hypothetical protein
MKEEVILYIYPDGENKKKKKKRAVRFLRSPDCVCVYSTVYIYTHTPCSYIL